MALQVTETGGRDATTRHIPPKLALAVGMPSTAVPEGWQWSALTELARLESGHTPSRRHPEYWEGTIPWIGIQDARAYDGGRIQDTQQHTNELGIANSSARVLPRNTVCLSRTASVGYAVVMGRPMATSQDFVNWVCSKDLEPRFLQYLFVAEGEDLLRFASGSVHQTIYFPEVKGFHICHPPAHEQRRIVGILDEAFDCIATARANAEKNLQNARALFEGHLQSVFTDKRWQWTTVGDLSDKVEYGSSAKSQKAGRMPVLRMGNIQDGRIDWEDLVYSDDKDEIEKYLLKRDDVLFNRTNSPALVGKTAIYKGEMPAIFAGYLIRIHRKEGLLDADYLNYFLNSQIALDHGKTVVTSSVNQANINGAKLKAYPIPAPPLVEQKRLVVKIDELSDESRRLEAIYQRKLAALDELKKSLLHQAFSGAL
ncbi:MAG: restriction endonuclease subunit S [Vicinamibacteria bacterium]